jgi:catalase
MAVLVAEGIGVMPPTGEVQPNHGRSSPALSQLNTAMDSVKSRRVAVLVADGVDSAGIRKFTEALRERGAIPELLAPHDGAVRDQNGAELPVDRAENTMASVLYDAVVVPGGPDSVHTLIRDGYAMHFVIEAFKHHKPVAAFGTGVELLERASLNGVKVARNDEPVVSDQGVITTAEAGDQLPERFIEEFCAVLARHRVWERETDTVPA